MAKIKVRVKTRCVNPRVEEFGINEYIIYVSSPPEDNKANFEMIKMLAHHLKVPSTKIKITAGLSSPNKILDVEW